MKLYYVYIMASRQRAIYIGITSKLEKRIWQHQNDFYPHSFTARYKCHKLVYFEEFTEVTDALAREKGRPFRTARPPGSLATLGMTRG